MNAYTVMSGKGQVVIPKDVRQRQQIGPGDRLEVVERADGVLLRRQPRTPVEDFATVTARIRARVSYTGPPVSVEEMSGAVAAMWANGGPDWDR